MNTYASDITLHAARHARLISTLAMLPLLAATGCAASTMMAPAGGYQLELGAHHPLVGRIYAGDRGSPAAGNELEAAARGARYLILGETHDNPDHHRLQAQLLTLFIDAHREASVAFEMLDEQDAPLLDQAKTPDEVAARVDWAHSGWPAFSMYRPVFEAAMKRGVQPTAAHPCAQHVRASMHDLPLEEARALHIDTPLPEAQQQAQRDEIRESHCGHANPAMTAAMQKAQVYKDAFMARALLSTRVPTVLITGRGHARKDRAVPYFLHRMHASSLSVAFMDVDDAFTAASDYDIAAYDFVVFTPRVTDADPCEEFRKQLQKMH